MSNSNLSWDDIMWGVSWSNVQMIMADTMRYDYKSKDAPSKESDVFDMSNPKSIEMLKKIASN